MAARKKVIIMGAAGRDFHDFNTYFRDKDYYEVVAFTATQIPDIAGRKYPAELAGKLYPGGIPIYPEEQLPGLIKKHNADSVIFSYSDVRHEDVMHKASLVIAAGAEFRMLGSKSTMLKSKKPVIAICAVRTGCGKSQTTRRVSAILRKKGRNVVVVRHPMPYGDLAKQAVQRFASYEDLEKHKCTIEEREEYEPHIDVNTVVYAGVDYQKILNAAEKEADIVLWDGGNNDIPFYKPKLHITVVDPHRPGHEVTYHPGEANLRMADVIIINKVETAHPENIEVVKKNIEKTNPNAIVVEAASPISVENPGAIRGKKVLVVEDGPTLTHGGMAYGAGIVAAKKFGAGEIIDPRLYAVGSINETFKKYSHLSNVLPAMGYSDGQIRELEKTINSSKCDTVIEGTPINLGRLVKVNKPIVKVRYELDEIGHPNLEEILKDF
jgi:predicted GTPase